MPDSKTIAGAQNRGANRFSCRARGLPSEHDEQALVAAWLDFHRIGFFAVPNGARVRPSVALRLRREGMRAGAPDLVLERLSADGRPVAVEMKRARGSTISPEQRACHARLAAEGWIVLVGHGADDAIGQLRTVLGV